MSELTDVVNSQLRHLFCYHCTGWKCTICIIRDEKILYGQWCYEEIHHNKMAGTSEHNKNMKNFM